MSLLVSGAPPPSPELFRQWGDRVLWGALGTGLLVTLGLAWTTPNYLFFIPLVLVASTVFIALVRRPLLHLCVVLAGFVTIFNYDEGIQVSEILFGLYYLGYVTLWIVYRSVFQGQQLLRQPIDYLVAAYIVYATLTLALNPIFGGSLFKGINEWRAMLVLAFYFPIREAARDPRALRAILATFVFIALFVTFRNFMQYFFALQSVEALWEVIQNRHRTNERLVMMALLGSLVFFLYYARTKWMYALLLALSVTFTASIMIGRSRTVWLAIGLALAVVFMLANRRDRVRLLLFGTTGFALVLGVGLLLFDDLFLLVLSGLGERFASIGTANQSDISMINRFYEWRTTWGHILESPIVGHGFGVPYHFYNLIYSITEHKTYTHNAYLGVLYRHGFIGLLLAFAMLGGSFIRGVFLVRGLSGRLNRSTALTALASMAALALAATTEPLLLPTDGVFAVMVPMALLAGLGERGVDTQEPHP